MEFTGDVAKDLKIFFARFRKEQIGFARIGDGEQTMIFGGKYRCTDGWVSAPGQGTYRDKLAKSVSCAHPAFHLGLRSPKHTPKMLWYFRHVKTPGAQMTDPCIFVNARWGAARKFFKAWRPKCCLVGSGRGVNIKIPKNCISPEYNYKPLLAKLLKVKNTILLAAGPLANILVAEYLDAGGKQSIIDMGTVLDMEMFGKPTRRYMRKAIAKKPKPKPKKKARRKGRKKRAVRKPVRAKRGKKTANRFSHLKISRKLRAQRRHK